METQLLEDIGLSQREIKVYLALIDLGQTTTGPLVKKSGVPNSKIYEILEKLIMKGLVNYIYRGKTKYFQSSNPNNLMHFFNEKQDKLHNLVQELDARKGSYKTQESFIYEGIEGVKAAFNNAVDILNNRDEICVFSMGTELATEKLRRFWNNHFRKRNRKGITTRAIPHISLRKIFPKYYGKYGINYKFTPLKLPMGTFLYKNHVLTLVWGEKPIAFIIKSQIVYDNYMNFFEMIWKKAKK